MHTCFIEDVCVIVKMEASCSEMMYLGADDGHEFARRAQTSKGQLVGIRMMTKISTGGI